MKYAARAHKKDVKNNKFDYRSKTSVTPKFNSTDCIEVHYCNTTVESAKNFTSADDFKKFFKFMSKQSSIYERRYQDYLKNGASSDSYSEDKLTDSLKKIIE